PALPLPQAPSPECGCNKRQKGTLQEKGGKKQPDGRFWHRDCTYYSCRTPAARAIYINAARPSGPRRRLLETGRVMGRPPGPPATQSPAAFFCPPHAERADYGSPHALRDGASARGACGLLIPVPQP